LAFLKALHASKNKTFRYKLSTGGSMDLFLKKQRKDVNTAEKKCVAANALSNHCSAEAKRQTTMLLSSAKGISTAFAAGAVKGSIDNDVSSSKQVSSIVTRLLFTL
jgi:nanoRNase/pAp phosphatase (c-di-AMP/oligoRNAs hydrolase)